MASPIAHSFAGFWTSLALKRRPKTQPTEHWRQYVPRLGLLILLANAPDLDLFMTPGFPGNALHRGFTHSLTVTILISLALSCAWRIAPGFWRSTVLYFTAYSSHILIDFFTGTRIGWTNTGFGMPLFWPWPQRFSSPLILIFGVHHKDFAALFSLDNIWACGYELLTCSVITAAAGILWKRKLKSLTLGKQKLKSQPNRPTSEPPGHLLSKLQHQK
jgi:membrane-bound metal-dependent hydrolase YbcI (DUF457 family)